MNPLCLGPAMKTLTSALLITLLAISQLANGTTKSASASFDVSFEITEACAVESSYTNPVVNCQYNSPYVTQHAERSRNPLQFSAASQARLWTVTF